MIKKNTPEVSAILFLASHLLLSLICVVHLLVMLTYFLGQQLTAFLFPASVITAVGLNFLLANRLGIARIPLLVATAISLLVLVVSLVLSWFFFDFSWDGQWYQQAAVYDLADHWNPLFAPLLTPDNSDNASILHFPKSTWYFGAAVLRLFGTVEMGKAYNFLVLFIALGVVYAFCRNVRLSKKHAAFFTGLVLINPVVWSELTTYLNDGDLYLLLVIYLMLTTPVSAHLLARVAYFSGVRPVEQTRPNEMENEGAVDR